MSRARYSLFLLLAGLCACRSSDDAEVAAATLAALNSRVLPSHEEIMGKVYDSSYSVPGNFLIDDRADTERSYTLYHVKDETDTYELCSSDLSSAQALEAADNESRAVNGAFVEVVETRQYFEFVRELAYTNGVGNISDPTSPGFARVFKCDYVDRTGVDRHIRSGFAGLLKTSPVTPAEMQTLTEYLWQFSFFWPVEKKVLQTFAGQTATRYSYTLVLALKTNRGDSLCDLIEVTDWVFSVDEETGEMSKEFNPLFQFDAELVDGEPRECSG